MKAHHLVTKRTSSEIQFTTAHVKVCVWPRCDEALTDSTRVGPLCVAHSSEVYEFWRELHERYDREPFQTPERRRQVQLLESQISEIVALRKRQEEARQIAPGWIYYVHVGDRIKVGYATDYRSRIRAYPPGSKLLAVHPGTPGLEREVHQRLATSRVAGREWYDPTPAVLAHVDRVLADFGPPRPERARAKGPGSRGGHRVVRG